MFASMKQYSLKCTRLFAADVKSRLHFEDKILAGSGLTCCNEACLNTKMCVTL